MGGGHVRHGKGPGEEWLLTWSRPRHRAPRGGDVEPDADVPSGPVGAAAAVEAVVVPAGTAGREPAGIASVGTAVLFAGVAGLVALGVVARWVSDHEETGSAVPSAFVELPDAAGSERPSREPVRPSGPDRDAPSPGSPTRTIGPDGVLSRKVVVVPESDCRRFLQTRARFPTLTISVENLCR